MASVLWKIFPEQMSEKQLHATRAQIDRLIRLERLKRVLATLAAQQPRAKRIVELRAELEKEIKVMEVRKTKIDECLEELEVLLDLE